MALAFPRHSGTPLGEMNTTPLIDVLLVLLVMFVISIPAGTHEVPIDLPGKPVQKLERIEPVRNSLGLTASGQVLWNGTPLSDDRLSAQLAAVTRTDPEPEVQFAPDPQASYARSAEVLRRVHAAGLTRFGFVGNERFRAFGRP